MAGLAVLASGVILGIGGIKLGVSLGGILGFLTGFLGVFFGLFLLLGSLMAASGHFNDKQFHFNIPFAIGVILLVIGLSPLFGISLALLATPGSALIAISLGLLFTIQALE